MGRFWIRRHYHSHMVGNCGARWLQGGGCTMGQSLRQPRIDTYPPVARLKVEIAPSRTEIRAERCGSERQVRPGARAQDIP